MCFRAGWEIENIAYIISNKKNFNIVKFYILAKFLKRD